MKKYMLFMSLLMALGLIAREDSSDNGLTSDNDSAVTLDAVVGNEGSDFNDDEPAPTPPPRKSRLNVPVVQEPVVQEEDDDYEGDPESDDEYDYDDLDPESDDGFDYDSLGESLDESFTDEDYDKAAKIVLNDSSATYDGNEFTDEQLMQIGVVLVGMNQNQEQENEQEEAPPVPPRKTGLRATNNSAAESDLSILTESLESLKEQVQVAGQRFIDNPELLNSEPDLDLVLNGWKKIDELSKKINDLSSTVLSSTVSEPTIESPSPVVEEEQFPDEQNEMINSYRESETPVIRCVIAAFDQDKDIDMSEIVTFLKNLNLKSNNYKQWEELINFSKEQKNKHLDTIIDTYLLNSTINGGLSENEEIMLRYELYKLIVQGLETVLQKLETGDKFTGDEKEAKRTELTEMLEASKSTFQELTNNYPSFLKRWFRR